MTIAMVTAVAAGQWYASPALAIAGGSPMEAGSLSFVAELAIGDEFRSCMVLSPETAPR